MQIASEAGRFPAAILLYRGIPKNVRRRFLGKRRSRRAGLADRLRFDEVRAQDAPLYRVSLNKTYKIICPCPERRTLKIITSSPVSASIYTK